MENNPLPPAFPVEPGKKDPKKGWEPFSNSREPFSGSERFLLPPKKVYLKESAKQILLLLTVDFLTPKQIAQRRQTSIRAVNKVIKNLREKGFINSGNKVGNLSQCTPLSREPFSPLKMRLHGQEWNIKLIASSSKYQDSRQKANTILIDGNTIRLYNKSIEIYSGQSFFEKDENRATALSMDYWMRFFVRLENELQVILVKPRATNINLVNQHYGETNSEMAKDAIQKGHKYRIETTDDGKLWFTIDNSWNLKEMETIHPETAKQDMTKIQKQVNDWRDYDPPTNSELGYYTIQNAKNLDEYAIHLKAHVESVQKLGSAVEELTEVIKELKK